MLFTAVEISGFVWVLFFGAFRCRVYEKIEALVPWGFVALGLKVYMGPI